MTRAGFSLTAALVCLILNGASASGQVTRADYDRAAGLRARYQDLAIQVADPATWIGDSSRFWYRKTVKGGHEFVTVSAPSLQRRPSFDHSKLAAALEKQTGQKVTALTLPFNSFRFVD